MCPWTQRSFLGITTGTLGSALFVACRRGQAQPTPTAAPTVGTPEPTHTPIALFGRHRGDANPYERSGPAWLSSAWTCLATRPISTFIKPKSPRARTCGVLHLACRPCASSPQTTQPPSSPALPSSGGSHRMDAPTISGKRSDCMTTAPSRPKPSKSPSSAS